MRRWMILVGLTLLLLIPLVAVAQGDVDDIIELVFTNKGAQIGVKDTITSVANVSIQLEGKEYLLQVPITVDIDATLPLTSSLVTVDSLSRVGGMAFQITDIEETTDEIEVVLPSPYSDEEEEFEPSVDGNKIVVIKFTTTNVGDEEDRLWSSSIKGVDATGRLFEEMEVQCDDMNPGETGRCVIVFDIDEAVDIVALDVEIMDHRQLPIPPMEKTPTPTPAPTPTKKSSTN